MRTLKVLMLGLMVIGAAGLARADTAWSTEDYDLYPGDFNGDGLSDLLYIARDARHLSGIALSDGAGFSTPLQSWGNAYLGIPWSDRTYRILVADFNGDGKDDLFLQRSTPGDHYVLLAEEGGIGAISQSVPNDAAGLDWSAKAHTLVAGDFNGDGRADLFLQATDPKALNALVLADAEGQFTAKVPAQSWEEGYAGFDWATSESLLYAGDFNGDGRDDLLVQALPLPGTGPGTNTPAAFAPNTNGVVLARDAQAIFATEGVQAWSRDGFKADWSPLSSQVIVGDFNGDARVDVLLQGQSAIDASYLVYGQPKGAIFATAEILGDVPVATDARLLAGTYNGGASSGLYAQARTASGSNRLITLSGTTPVTALSDAPLAFASGGSGWGAEASPDAPGGAGGAGTLALLTPNTPGRTPGQFAVSPMGAATYQIPIWSPPGARGIEPHLALVYTSGSPDGMMGPGWNLAGLSAIARCNKTYADNNGSPAAVTLTSGATGDDFCIDGNRMRVTSGTYGAANSVYQTMVANFSRITAYGTAGNGPSYFYVEGKDGLIYEYGNTADSKAYANAGTTPYAWMLNKVRDRQGNNLKVVYSTTSGAVQPSSISYTQTPSTNGTTYPYTVNFTYQNRVTNLSKYVAGGSISETKVLSKINVTLLGVTSVRQYNFTYETAPTTQRDRLASIQECAGSSGTECLKATTVTYQNGAAGIAAPTTLSGSGATVTGTLKTADFDGDGRGDLLYAISSGSNYAWYVQFGTATGFSSPVNTAAVTTPTGNVLPDDWLGDGRHTILAPNGSTWYLYKWNPATSSFLAVSTGAALDANLGNTQAASADTDGDGRPDLVTTPGAAGSVNVYVRKNTSAAGTPSFAAAVVGFTVTSAGLAPAIRGNGSYPASSVRNFDWDGDGRDDLVMQIGVFDQIRLQIVPALVFLSSKGSTFNGNGPAIGASLGGFLPVRWNDDACSDFLWNNGQPSVSVSACNGTSAVYIQIPTTASMALDWDGDGRTDILSIVSGGWTMYRSLGTAVATGVATGIAASSGQWITLDRNGDGESDLAFSDAAAGNAIKTGLHNGVATPPDLATTITDGWGVYATAAYVPITQSNYTKYNTAVFPESDFQGAAYVVSRATQPDGIGGSFYNDFSYFGARIHRQGRGFAGFEKTQSWDSRNGLYHLVNYKQAFPYTGVVALDRVYQPDGTSLISQTDNQYKVITVSDLADTTGSKCLQTTPLLTDTRCFPYLDIASSESHELTAGNPLIQTSVTDTDVDDYGNPTKVVTKTTDNDASSPFVGGEWKSEVNNTITNYTTSPQWCLGKPTRTTTTNTVPNQPVLTRTVDHTVDATNCRFNSETIEPTIALLTVATTFGYDSCGNVNSVAIVGKDKNGAAMPARTTTSAFGTRCTFPETVTNALSQSTTNVYNYTYGVKSSTTDPNGVAVSWGYDSFGRRTSETRPDATSTTWTYEDCITPACWGLTDNLRFKITERLYDSASVQVRAGEKYFDALERLKYADTQRVLGIWTYTKTVYNNLGLKYEVHQPYSTTTNGFHRYAYDLLNRPISDKLFNASGVQDRETMMAYAGLQTVLTDARGKKTWKKMDVAGKLRRIIDPDPVNGTQQGATTYHEYDAFGNLVQMKDANLVQTDYQYNLRGFKTSSSDPDTGSWNYTPNSLNELVEQRDAKNQLTSFGYDLLGRLTSRIEPESPTATTWTYGTSAAAHNIGRLQSLSKPDGYQESYTFDSLGRPAVSTYTMDSTAYAVDYTYNTLGAVDTLKYPTSSTGYRFTLKYVYSLGYVQQVKDNAAGTIFWSLNAANDYGSPTTEVLGNTATIATGYTPWTNDLTSRQIVKGTTLQNLAYQWDLGGNLTQRQDIVQSLSEVFTYDNLNRLDIGTLNGSQNLNVDYSANGNITTKSDAGTFDYTTPQAGCDYTGLTAQPHAVRKVGTTVYCYDKNGNMTSRAGSGISWYSYNQPNRINAGAYYSEFSYNANHQRWKQVATDASGTTTTRYIGGILEKLDRPGGVTEYRHMIPAGSGSVIYMRKPDGSNATTYLTTDHLGSGDLILDSSGNVLAKMSFTPFGARRGSNWQGAPSSTDYTTFSNKTNRGFTGHEMLDAIGLVNMNGRVYDPLIGRFLSADPIIQTINLSQALNPYSYVMNMPLTLIDPSGYSWLSKLFSNIGKFFKKWGAMIIGVIMTVMGQAWYWAALLSSTFNAAVNGGTFGSFITGLVVGAIAGAIAAPIGDAISGALRIGGQGLLASVGRGAITGAFAGGIASSISGRSFWAGFAGGALAGAMAGGLTWGAQNYLGGKRTVSDDGSADDDSYMQRSSIKFTKNADGTLTSSEIDVEYSPAVNEDTAKAYFDSITTDFERRGIHLNFKIVGPSDHPGLGVEIYLTTCARAPDGCGYWGLGAADRGGRMMYYSPTQNANTPTHEFNHILGRGHASIGIMSGQYNRTFSRYDFQRIETCYVYGNCGRAP
jgi:RHS repeat-associated protein